MLSTEIHNMPLKTISFKMNMPLKGKMKPFFIRKDLNMMSNERTRCSRNIAVETAEMYAAVGGSYPTFRSEYVRSYVSKYIGVE